MVKGMERASCYTITAGNMKEIGNVISNMEKAIRNFKMEPSTRVFL